jgi:PhnB protein
MLGWPGPEYEGPARHAEHCDAARRWCAPPFVIDGALVFVEDVDQHAERARSAGATILRAPEDAEYGRLYVASDLEGHRWMFLQPSPG